MPRTKEMLHEDQVIRLAKEMLDTKVLNLDLEHIRFQNQFHMVTEVRTNFKRNITMTEKCWLSDKEDVRKKI
jgi:hypothetical protein